LNSEIPLLLLWFGSAFVLNTNFTLCQVYEVKNFTVRLDHFVSGALSTQASCVPGILQFRKPKCCQIFETLLFDEKGWTIPHEKFYFLLDMNFLKEEITNLASNFT
jgi:hypothetical protein